MSARRFSLSALRGRLSRPSGWTVLNVLIAAVAIWTHVRLLNQVPMGFYTDEVSIAYNAYLIGSTGEDEFGVAWPLYTRSVNDYKNPGYVYFAVLVIRLCGFSTWTVRLPSVLCWLFGSTLLYALGRRLWWRPELRALLLLMLAFTPSLFCLSRVAFEVIALYPVLALFLFAVQRGFDGHSLRWAAVAGLAIGCSTYVYTTFRLLAPLHCLLVVLCYFSWTQRRRLLAFGAAALLSALPFAWYLYAHGANLTRRYQEIGYLHLPLSFAEKRAMFMERYLGYFDPAYLLEHGDPNARHHTGYGGEFFAATVLGVLLALTMMLFDARQRRARFNWVLLGGLGLAPVAAAFTKDQFHSLRGFSLVVFGVLLSVQGFDFAARLAARAAQAIVTSTSLRGRVLRAAPGLLVVALAGASIARSSAGFVEHYFGPYATASIRAFQFYGFRQAIIKAVRLHPKRIIVDNRRPGRHGDLHAKFVVTQLARRRHDLPPIVAGRAREVRPGEMFVFEDWKGLYPWLRDGLPPGSLYLAVRYEQLPAAWWK